MTTHSAPEYTDGTPVVGRVAAIVAPLACVAILLVFAVTLYLRVTA